VVLRTLGASGPAWTWASWLLFQELPLLPLAGRLLPFWWWLLPSWAEALPLPPWLIAVAEHHACPRLREEGVLCSRVSVLSQLSAHARAFLKAAGCVDIHCLTGR
jgi:hypothetical protein